MIGIEMMSIEKRINARDDIETTIINIASVVGLDPLHLVPVYSASKHAIVGFSRAYSVRSPFNINHLHFIYVNYVSFNLLQHDTYHHRSGVKIVVLCPGATTTNFVRQFSGNMIVPDEREALQFFRLAPKQRFLLIILQINNHLMEVYFLFTSFRIFTIRKLSF